MLKSLFAASRKAVAVSMAFATVVFTIPAAASIEKTATPIKHLVVIFQENVSFDHYFATYPVALNLPGEPGFVAKRGTPTVNGLHGALLNNNPNFLNKTNNGMGANGMGAVNPFRLDRSQVATADQGHGYTAEQSAAHSGLMDLFPKFVGAAGPPPAAPPAAVDTKGL